MRIDRDAVLDRQSVPLHWSGDVGGEDEEGGESYVLMLEEDIGLGLMPIGGRIRKTDQPCVRLLSGDGEASRDLKALVAAAMAGDRDSLESAVAERINQTAAAVVAHGRAVYEIAYYRHGAKVVGFVLLYLDPRFVRESRGSFTQEIPVGTRIPGETIQEAPREVAERERSLDAGRVLSVSWPSRYAKGLEWTHQLRWLARAQYPRFLLENLSGPETSRVPYDFDRFREAQDQALAASTRTIGWNARGSFDRRQTSYYYCLREVRFARFKITFRDHILASINQALVQAGREVGFDARLSLEGLPVGSDVVSAEEALGAGKLSYKEIVDRFSLY